MCRVVSNVIASCLFHEANTVAAVAVEGAVMGNIGQPKVHKIDIFPCKMMVSFHPPTNYLTQSQLS